MQCNSCGNGVEVGRCGRCENRTTQVGNICGPAADAAGCGLGCSFPRGVAKRWPLRVVGPQAFAWRAGDVAAVRCCVGQSGPWGPTVTRGPNITLGVAGRVRARVLPSIGRGAWDLRPIGWVHLPRSKQIINHWCGKAKRHELNNVFVSFSIQHLFNGLFLGGFLCAISPIMGGNPKASALEVAIDTFEFITRFILQHGGDTYRGLHPFLF